MFHEILFSCLYTEEVGWQGNKKTDIWFKHIIPSKTDWVGYEKAHSHKMPKGHNLMV